MRTKVWKELGKAKKKNVPVPSNGKKEQRKLWEPETAGGVSWKSLVRKAGKRDKPEDTQEIETPGYNKSPSLKVVSYT